jgi:hypothetical protein
MLIAFFEGKLAIGRSFSALQFPFMAVILCSSHLRELVTDQSLSCADTDGLLEENLGRREEGDI